MKPFFSTDVLATVSREELQLIRRCISYRMTDYEMVSPEEATEIKMMETLYQDVTKILEILPF